MKKKLLIKFKIRRIIVFVLVFMLLLIGTLLLPTTQTYMGQRFTSGLNERFGAEISVERVQVSPFGYVKVHNLLAFDHKQDTLIYVGFIRLNTLRLRAVLQDDDNLGDVFLKDVTCNITTYKGEEDSNIKQFFSRFKNESKTKNTSISASSISLINANLIIANQNKNTTPQQFASLNAEIKDFNTADDVIYGDILQLNTTTNWMDTELTSLSGKYSFSQHDMRLMQASIQTKESVLAADIQLSYPEDGLKDFVNAVSFDVDLGTSEIGPSDLQKIIPNWSGGNLSVQGVIDGSLGDFSLQGVKIDDDNMALSLTAKVLNFLNKKKRYIKTNFTLTIPKTDISLPVTLAPQTQRLVISLGSLAAENEITYEKGVWKVTSNLNTALGNMVSVAAFEYDEQKTLYSLELHSNKFDVGTFIDVPTIGRTGLHITLSGNGIDLPNLNAQTKGVLTNLDYRDYTYEQVSIEGVVNPERYVGSMNIRDTALNLDLEGQVDYTSLTRNFSFSADIKQADFNALGWIPNSIQGVFSGSVDLALQGNTIDEMIGDLYIESGSLKTPKKSYSFASLAAQSRLTNGLRVVNINSEDVATGLLIGDFKPTELGKIIQNALGSQFEHYNPIPVSPNQQVDFNFNLRGKIAAALFSDAIMLDDNTFLKGSVNANEQLFTLELRAPKIRLNSTEISGLTLNIDTQQSIYHSFISLDEMVSPQIHIYDAQWINAQVGNKLYGRMEFLSEKPSEDLNIINTSFTINDTAQAVFEIQDAELFFNKKKWNIEKKSANPILIASDLTHFTFSNLNLKTGQSAIIANGAQNGNDSFLIDVSFSDVFMQDLLSFQDEQWEGIVNGFLNIRQSSLGFGGNSSLHFSDLVLNNIPLGEADVKLESRDDSQDYQLALSFAEEGDEVFTANGSIGLEGDKPIWDINTVFNNYNLSLIAGLTHETFAPFSGRANGTIRLTSSKGLLSPKGELFVDDMVMGVPYLNTLYSFPETVPFRFDDETINIPLTTFTSSPSQTGTLQGILSHQSFSNWGLDLKLEADQLEVLNTPFSENALYYGNAFFNGNAHLHGTFSNMEIDVEGETAKGTSIFIPIQYDTTIGDVSFINFVEKQQQEQQVTQLDQVKGLQLNFDLDVTPDAEVEIVVDPETKSFMRGRGAGNLLLEIDTAGSFAMWGDFIAFDGIYNFKNLGLIDKTFRLMPGGVIFWEGDPYGAQINMQAVYDVPGGANPAVLLEGDNVSQKIPTEVSISLFGNLLNPETPTFEINFPNASGIVRNELNYRLNDQERRQLQAISLLSQGSFINEVSLAAISSQTLTTNLFQKASGVFDNIFTNENDKLNLGIDYLQGDRNAAVSIKNRDRLGVSLSTNINERILIDGKVGVPVGNEEETTIIGNVKLEFLLNKKGDLRARAFNKENEFQYFGDELGYTQGIGIGYQVRFDSFKELITKIFNKKVP